MPHFTLKEQEKLNTLNLCIQKKMTNAQAATMLRLSVRQVKRLKKRVREQGASAVIHQLKGRIGNHHHDLSTKQKALEKVKEKYLDFKPTLAAEKLAEYEGLVINCQTLRKWMVEAGLWRVHRQRKVKYHS